MAVDSNIIDKIKKTISAAIKMHMQNLSFLIEEESLEVFYKDIEVSIINYISMQEELSLDLKLITFNKAISDIYFSTIKKINGICTDPDKIIKLGLDLYDLYRDSQDKAEKTFEDKNNLAKHHFSDKSGYTLECSSVVVDVMPEVQPLLFIKDKFSEEKKKDKGKVQSKLKKEMEIVKVELLLNSNSKSKSKEKSEKERIVHPIYDFSDMLEEITLSDYSSDGTKTIDGDVHPNLIKLINCEFDELSDGLHSVKISKDEIFKCERQYFELSVLSRNLSTNIKRYLLQCINIIDEVILKSSLYPDVCKEINSFIDLGIDKINIEEVDEQFDKKVDEKIRDFILENRYFLNKLSYEVKVNLETLRTYLVEIKKHLEESNKLTNQNLTTYNKDTLLRYENGIDKVQQYLIDLYAIRKCYNNILDNDPTLKNKGYKDLIKYSNSPSFKSKKLSNTFKVFYDYDDCERLFFTNSIADELNTRQQKDVIFRNRSFLEKKPPNSTLKKEYIAFLSDLKSISRLGVGVLLETIIDEDMLNGLLKKPCALKEHAFKTIVSAVKVIKQNLSSKDDKKFQLGVKALKYFDCEKLCEFSFVKKLSILQKTYIKNELNLLRSRYIDTSSSSYSLDECMNIDEDDDIDHPNNDGKVESTASTNDFKTSLMNTFGRM